MVIGLVIITAKPGCRGDVLRVYKAVIPKVLEEKGCIQYIAAKDLYYGPAQSLLGEESFALIGMWESLEEFEAHAVSGHMEACRSRVEEIVVDRTFHLVSSVKNAKSRS